MLLENIYNNISLYFEHLDIILKILGLKLNNVLNPALIKNNFYSLIVHILF